MEALISRKEWESIVEGANLVIGNDYNLRKLEENVIIPICMNIIFWIIFYFCLIDFIFLIIFTKKEDGVEIPYFFEPSMKDSIII